MADTKIDIEKKEDGETESPNETQPLNQKKSSAPATKPTSTSKPSSVSPTSSAPASKAKVRATQGKQCTCCPCCSCSRAVVMAVVGVMFMVYALALALGLGLGLRGDDPTPGAEGQEGMRDVSGTPRRAVGGVAADHTACSEVGRDIMAQNGSAVDAAIASLVCVGVRQPHSMGIGGGLFLAVYRKNPPSVEMFDGRETAPAAATYEKYLNQSFTFGPLSIGVPGEIKAYWAAHQKYGRLAWKELFKPAIAMAAGGHPLSESTARAFIILRDSFNVNLRDLPELCKIFCNESDEPKQAGDIVKMPALARTLQGIADLGPDYLYSSNSTAAVNFTQDIKDFGGLVTLDDLENYKVVTAPPVSASLGDLTLHTLTAPSGGPVLALVLKILNGLNLSPEDLTNTTTKAAMWHKIVETFKFAYADRLKLGDPAFVNVTQLMEKMASPEYADYLRESIDFNRTYGPEHYTDIAGAPWDERGTTHISVISPDGDAVSATSTINYYFGSLLMSPSTGIILNNEMADFLQPTGADENDRKPNDIEPGKRPLSSMAPLIVVDKDGNPRLVLGSAGGARITPVNAQVTTRVLWLNQTLKEAIDAKRLHHQLFPNHISWETGFPQDVLDELQNRYGHELEQRKTYMAVVQAVARDPDTGEVTAYSDWRKKAYASVLYEDQISGFEKKDD